MTLGLPPKETWASAMILVPGAPFKRDSEPVATNTFTVCLPALQLREHIVECDIRLVIAVVINVESIDCVGMKCVRVRICIEDEHSSVLVNGRLECIEIAEIESLIAQRRAETESSEVV